MPTATVTSTRPLACEIGGRSVPLGGDPVRIEITDRTRRDLHSLAGTAGVTVEWPPEPKRRAKSEPKSEPTPEE